MPKSVAVLDGGVAGLSAAHELAERGYDVTVYEKKVMFGGKARSLSVPNTATGGRRDLPGRMDSGSFRDSTNICPTPWSGSRSRAM